MITVVTALNYPLIFKYYFEDPDADHMLYKGAVEDEDFESASKYNPTEPISFTFKASSEELQAIEDKMQTLMDIDGGWNDLTGQGNYTFSPIVQPIYDEIISGLQAIIDRP